MPTITVADHAGACYGVQRALELVQKVAQQATGPVHTLGPLIHNPQVVEGLASQGVTVVDDVPTQAGSTLVLRTHGVVPQVEQAARDFGLDVVDSELTSRVPEVCVVNTICEATSERQQAARKLAAASDVMVVIGGRNSANTTRLAKICLSSCAKTHHIETCDELSASWFEGASSIGVTAGASTPTAQIDELVSRIESLCASSS